jgi:hypothetical protein
LRLRPLGTAEKGWPAALLSPSSHFQQSREHCHLVTYHLKFIINAHKSRLPLLFLSVISTHIFACFLSWPSSFHCRSVMPSSFSSPGSPLGSPHTWTTRECRYSALMSLSSVVCSRLSSSVPAVKLFLAQKPPPHRVSPTPPRQCLSYVCLPSRQPPPNMLVESLLSQVQIFV